MIRVAQCWDDGVATDIRLTELLRKYNAKATFNLCPGTMREETIAPSWDPQRTPGWSHHGFRGGKVGKKDLLKVYGGFRVASHCWRHETAGSYPLDQFVKAAVDARKFLEDVFQKDCPGFAWPCGAAPDDAAKALADAGFAYGRTTKNVEDVGSFTNPLQLHSNCHFMALDFWTRFDAAKQAGHDFYFWGHSYEMMDSEGLWKQFEDRLAMLCADPDVVWVDVVDLVRR